MTAADPEAVRRLVKMGLTEKKAAVFLYIFETAMRCGYQPSYRDIMAHMGVSSPNSIALIIASLERAGFVKGHRGDSRALRLLRTPSGAEFRGFCLPGDLEPGEADPRTYPMVVERCEDMSPLGRLRLMELEDGDIIVACIPDPDGSDAVEFCTPFIGGGRSPHTLAALRKLAEAMEQDNRENPIGRPDSP